MGTRGVFEAFHKEPFFGNYKFSEEGDVYIEFLKRERHPYPGNPHHTNTHKRELFSAQKPKPPINTEQNELSTGSCG